MTSYFPLIGILLVKQLDQGEYYYSSLLNQLLTALLFLTIVLLLIYVIKTT
ncbi:hypothetical protein [Siphonobacter sp. SORGH_AS_0500]|uniref:hypothetical protein n=1 Tax=Siphonobacter sp. SORGH_AS_0500 TaxID=1864824 RepID=UPI00285E9FDA|nr:hypothetical protein [Siphonobacter sp. SORGH_AS_0500]MDR6196830.1 hypothetical protein [Siphonobacter sp. SORGH_AS_0500]